MDHDKPTLYTPLYGATLEDTSVCLRSPMTQTSPFPGLVTLPLPLSFSHRSLPIPSPYAYSAGRGVACRSKNVGWTHGERERVTWVLGEAPSRSRGRAPLQWSGAKSHEAVNLSDLGCPTKVANLPQSLFFENWRVKFQT